MLISHVRVRKNPKNIDQYPFRDQQLAHILFFSKYFWTTLYNKHRHINKSFLYCLEKPVILN